MRLRPKLTLSMVVAALLPLVVAMGVVVWETTVRTEQLTLQKVQGQLDAGAQRLSGFFAARMAEVSAYARTPTLMSGDFASARPFLLSELGRHQGVYEKFIFGLPENGHFYNTAGGNPHLGGLRTSDDSAADARPKTIRKRDYWQMTVGHNDKAQAVTYVSNPMISYTTGAKQVVVAATVLRDGEVQGMIGGALPWPDLERRIQLVHQDLSRELGAERFFLVSHSGIYWYHWDSDKVVHILTDEQGVPVRNDIGEKVAVRVKITDEPIEALAEAGRQMEVGYKGYRAFRNPRTGAEEYVVYSPLTASGYGVGLVLSAEQVLAPVRELQTWFVLITLAAVMIVATVAMLLGGRIAAPIVSLSQAATQLGKGHWRVLRPEGDDEAADLAHAFNQMVESLRGREELLSASEERFALAMRGASDGLWDWEVKSGTVYFSPRWKAMLGYEEHELPSALATWQQRLHPDDADRVSAVLHEVLDGERYKYEVEFRLRHKDGHYVDILSRAIPVRNPDTGEVTRMVGTHVDISERKRNEEAIRELNQELEQRVADRTRLLEDANTQLEARKAQLIEAQRIAGIAHWHWDLRDGSFDWSEEGSDIFGVEPGRFDGSITSFLNWVHADDRERVRSAIVNAVHDDHQFSLEHRVRYEDGRERDVQQVGKVSVDAEGHWLSITGTVRDITEQKKVERLKNEFVSTVSHELRTPLTSIHGSLALMQGGVAGELPAKAEELVKLARNNSDRLLSLINDILDIDKIASNGLQFRLRSWPLTPLLAQSVEENLGYAEKFGVRLELVTADREPDVNVDADRLKQVMANLLSNAIKFAPADSVVEVKVENHRPGWVRVSVKDEGPGIPDEFHDDIFQKFSQADGSDTRKAAGSGLGLSIVKSILEQMNGRIDFRSVEGEGTVFYFDLPVAAEKRISA